MPERKVYSQLVRRKACEGNAKGEWKQINAKHTHEAYAAYALQGASTAPMNLHIPGLLLLTARAESQPALGRLRTYVGFSSSALVLSIDPFQLNVA